MVDIVDRYGRDCMGGRSERFVFNIPCKDFVVKMIRNRSDAKTARDVCSY
jgi:hypothetical protein